MAIAGEGARHLFRPSDSAIAAAGIGCQAAKPAAIGEDQNRAARSAAPAAVILGFQSILATGGDRARADNRAGMDDDDSAAGGSAAEDAGAVSATIAAAGVRGRIPERTVVGRTRAASATHDQRACGRGKSYSAKATHQPGAVPAKSANSSRAAVATAAAAAILVVSGRICVRGPAAGVARCAARETAVGKTFGEYLAGVYRRCCRCNGAEGGRDKSRRSRNALGLRSVLVIRGKRDDVGANSGPASQDLSASATGALAVQTHGATKSELRGHVQHKQATHGSIPREGSQSAAQRGGCVLRNANDLECLYALRGRCIHACVGVQQPPAGPGAGDRHRIGASPNGDGGNGHKFKLAGVA